MTTSSANPSLSGPEYRVLVEQAPILIWRSGTDMLCNYFNERWLAYTGRTMEQEYGNGWAEGVHPDDFDRCIEIYTTHFENQEVFEMEYRLRRADGEYRWLFDRGVPFHHDDGTFGGYIGSCVDVHSRVVAERELARVRQEQLDRLQSLLPVCAWCGKLRTDHGDWRTVTDYLAELGFGKATHGICEQCEASMD